MHRGPRRWVAVAAALLADHVVGQPPLEPPPRDALDALADVVVAGLPEDLPGVAVEAALAASGAAAGAVVRSTALAAYLTAGGSQARAEAQHLGELVVLGRAGAPDAGAAVDRLAEALAEQIVGPALAAATGGAPGALAAATRRGRHPHPAGPTVAGAATAALLAAVRPWAARDIAATSAIALRERRSIESAAVRAALGLTGRDIAPGDVPAAGRLLTDATLALAVGLLVAAAAEPPVRWTVHLLAHLLPPRRPRRPRKSGIAAVA